MSSDLVRRGIDIVTVDDAERLARIAVASGLTALRRPEEAAVILLTGRELGLAPMQSLRGIHVVQGRPVLSADLMVAIVRRSGLCASWRTVESTPDVCTIETRREGEPEATRKTWTMADATRAGLGPSKGGNWRSYPAQMLRHRCAADLAREVYPDVVLGLYDPDELAGVEPRGTLDAVVLRPVVDVSAALDAIAAASSCEAVVAAYRAAHDALRAQVSLDAPDAAPHLAAILDAAIATLGALGLHLPSSRARAVVAHDELAAIADELLGLAAAGRRAHISAWWLAHRSVIAPGLLEGAEGIAIRVWGRCEADADAAHLRGVRAQWTAALAAPPAPPPAEEHGLVTALREHLAVKPSGAAPGTREHTSQLAAVAASYHKRLPDIVDAGREDDALDVVRAELTRRGCSDPDALLAGVAARRKPAKAE